MNIEIVGDMDSDSLCRVVYRVKLSDEYLWEFIEPQEFLERVIDPWYLYQFTHRGGCVHLDDTPIDGHCRFHNIEIIAWHPKSQYLDWLEWSVDWTQFPSNWPIDNKQ